MDIRALLAELGHMLNEGRYAEMRDKCDAILAQEDMPPTYKVLVLDQKIKALTALNDSEGAVAACREEIPLLEAVFGAEHMHVANALHNLSMYLGVDNKREEALAVSAKELEIVRKLAPGTSREADALVSMAEHEYESSRFAQADELLLQALAIYEACEGRRCLGVSTCLNNLGRSSEHQGKNEQGVTYLEEASSIREELLGVHPDSAFTMLNYGTALVGIGKFFEAAKVLTHCAALYEALGMSDSQYAAACHENLKLCTNILSPQEEHSCCRIR